MACGRRSALVVITIMLLSETSLTAQTSRRSPTPSAGKAIDDATRAAVLDRIADDASRPDPANMEKADGKAHPTRSWFGPLILSDTGDVDFGPYVRDLYSNVLLKWHAAIQTEEYAQYANGQVAIQFTVKKDGSVIGMKVVESSGDETMDRAAWTGITSSSPFSPLPPNFAGNVLQIRLRFYYNPSQTELMEAHRSGVFPPI